jgi:hypothetical protein
LGGARGGGRAQFFLTYSAEHAARWRGIPESPEPGENQGVQKKRIVVQGEAQRGVASAYGAETELQIVRAQKMLFLPWRLGTARIRCLLDSALKKHPQAPKRRASSTKEGNS